MRRIVFIVLAGLLLASLGLAARAADPKRPNVVIILADDLGWADLGCYGSKFHRTPHLDRLAGDGLRFAQGYAACPVCSPTRASILTGKYPARYNLTDWLPGRADRPDQQLARPQINQQLPLNEVTLAESLQSAGYATGLIGKWHLGGAGFEPQQQGFASNIGGDQTGTPLSYFAPFRRGDRVMPGLEQAPAGEYLPDRYSLEAERFIERHRDRPFFLYLAHNVVHTPIQAKPEYVSQYSAERQPGRQSNPDYAAMVQSLDDSVGRVVAKLEECQLADNTLVIFTSDNGGLCVIEGPKTPATINAPLREGKGYLYEGGIRVPLIMKWPGRVRSSAVTQTAACSIDLLPTVLAACGVRHPVEVDGVDLAPLWEGKELPPREGLYWHYPHYSNQGGKPGGAVRRGPWKLIEFFETGRQELFNVERDPSESSNQRDQQPALAAELAAQLAAWRKQAGARMMEPNPAFVPNPQGADGVVSLPARTAHVHGAQLRYEPLPHKNTLGYWMEVDDWAHWDLTITKPGKFAVEILQGCGKGSGGSRVQFTVAGQTLETDVQDTGHFQNFVPRMIGEVTLDRPGRHTLEARAKSKPGVAVMDLRSVTLKPVRE